jgi:polyribonucleotide nucleotidyltransferase
VQVAFLSERIRLHPGRILHARRQAIARPLRPLFPGSWFYETQIVGKVISAETDNGGRISN